MGPDLKNIQKNEVRVEGSAWNGDRYLNGGFVDAERSLYLANHAAMLLAIALLPSHICSEGLLVEIKSLLLPASIATKLNWHC